MSSRIEWLDSVKALAAIWIVLFHCTVSYGGNLPQPFTFGSLFDFASRQCAQGSTIAYLYWIVVGIIAGIFQRGSQAVGVFILFSGFGLTLSLAKKGGAPGPWIAWYKRRFIRLFPVYWLAHLVFLTSPFVVLHDPADYRFVLSFFGDRVYPVDKMFFYFVPAWWFMGLLIELYIVFPLLYELMRRLGPMKYLGLCILSSIVAKYLLTVLGVNGNYAMGAFFVCRLWEFAAGMALGKLLAENPDLVLSRMISWKCFLAGIASYALGVFVYQPNLLFLFSDGLMAMGLAVILVQMAYRLKRAPGLRKTLPLAGIYSYGIYLLHQPYMIYVGEKLRPYSLPVFLLFAFAAAILVAPIASCLEYATNRFVNFLSGKFSYRF